MSGRLRCWPGCLAYITHPRMYGVTVEVLYAAPVGSFTLPDGFPAWHGEVAGAGWVVRSPSPIRVPVSDGLGGRFERLANYASIPDKHLRPITPPPGTDCTTHDADKPQPVEAA